MTDNKRTMHLLQERIKELTALHATARILQSHRRPLNDLLEEVVRLLPQAWQYPEIAGARIRCLNRSWLTERFVESKWLQVASFAIENETPGQIEISYSAPRPDEDEGPFLTEERNLIDSLAELLRSHLQHRLSDEALAQAQRTLEEQVRDRTDRLEKVNAELRDQVAEQQRNERQIREYQRQLQKLALELSLSEARERREIASDLHDHIGQALAFTKLKLSELQGNAVFCGFEDSLSEVMELLDQTITYTRDLTVQISPPVLYEFGLAAAIDWRAAQMQRKHGLKIKVDRGRYRAKPETEIAVMLFKSVGELLTNVVKHARADAVHLSIVGDESEIAIEISDDGRGFDFGQLGPAIASDGKFGLFSVQERIRLLGGRFAIDSAPGHGTRVRLSVPLLKDVVREKC